MEFLLILIIALLGWGLKLIRTDLKFLEYENAELRKSNKEMLEANHKLTRKSKNKY